MQNLNEIEVKIESLINGIEKLVNDHQLSWIEACVLYCERHNVEIDTVGDIIKKQSKVKGFVQREAEQLRMMKR